MKLEDFETLQDAHAYTETQGRLISPDMMLSFITGFGLIGPLIDAPATDLAKSVKAAMTFGSEFNLITGHPQTIIALANGLVAQGTVPQNFIDALVAYANPTVYQFLTSTEYDFQFDKGTYTLLPLIKTGTSVVINVTTTCELHNPAVFGLNPLTDKYEKVTAFMRVRAVGKYEAKLQPTLLHWNYFVADAYGVIEAV